MLDCIVWDFPLGSQNHHGLRMPSRRPSRTEKLVIIVVVVVIVVVIVLVVVVVQEEGLVGRQQGTIVMISDHQIMILCDHKTSLDHQELDSNNENA